MKSKIVLNSFVGLTYFFGVACTQNRAADISYEKQNLKSADQITTVQTAVVQKKEFEYLIPLTGKIKPLYEQKILSESNGILIQCQAANGVTVEQGQCLARLSTSGIELRLARARNAVYNSQLEYQSALLGYNRNIITIPDSVTKKIKAASGLTGAELELKEAELELSKATMVSPIKGKLVDVKVQAGMTVRTGDELFTVYSHQEIFLEAKILETDVLLVQQGQRAEIKPLAGNIVSGAVITEINPRVDESGMVQVRLKIINSNGLMPGMNATAILSIPRKQSLVVPKEAVVMRGGKPVVFTSENNLAKWNYVNIGRDNGKELEIIEGLKAEQKAIITNNLLLAHDSPIRETDSGAK